MAELQSSCHSVLLAQINSIHIADKLNCILALHYILILFIWVISHSWHYRGLTSIRTRLGRWLLESGTVCQIVSVELLVVREQLVGRVLDWGRHDWIVSLVFSLSSRTSSIVVVFFFIIIESIWDWGLLGSIASSGVWVVFSLVSIILGSFDSSDKLFFLFFLVSVSIAVSFWTALLYISERTDTSFLLGRINHVQLILFVLQLILKIRNNSFSIQGFKLHLAQLPLHLDTFSFKLIIILLCLFKRSLESKRVIRWSHLQVHLLIRASPFLHCIT